MKFFKILLFPFTIIYQQITNIRSFLYNKHYLKSIRFEVMTINVGNLTVGGTGKTPHIEYLIELLKDEYKLSTLSRGYRRETKGFILADHNTDAKKIGDEPFQFFLKFGHKIKVAVGEERALAIPNILLDNPDTQVILLDDAYQHRAVNPHINILLTDYQRLFYKDYPFPTGMLRESRRGAKRADMVIVTKCPKHIIFEEKEMITRGIRKYAKKDVNVFFTSIEYAQFVLPVFENNKELSINSLKSYEVVLFSGIAQNKLLINWAKENFQLNKVFTFSDHFKYKSENLQKILDYYETIKTTEKIILCTEKDYVKLKTDEFQMKFGNSKVYYIPIKITFLDDGGKQFDEFIKEELLKVIGY